jgi:integrase
LICHPGRCSAVRGASALVHHQGVQRRPVVGRTTRGTKGVRRRAPIETGVNLGRWRRPPRIWTSPPSPVRTWVVRSSLDLLRYRDEVWSPGFALDELFVDQDGGPLTTNAVQCVLWRLRAKLGLKRLSAHQFRRTWATNFRRTGVGDPFDLRQAGGWDDLEVPQRFYVEVGTPKAVRASVMDRLELARKRMFVDASLRPFRPSLRFRGFRQSKIPKTVALRG